MGGRVVSIRILAYMALPPADRAWDGAVDAEGCGTRRCSGDDASESGSGVERAGDDRAHQKWAGAADLAPRTLLGVERDGKHLMVRHLCNAETCHLFLEEQPTALQTAALAPLGLTRRDRSAPVGGPGQDQYGDRDILGLSPRTVQKHLEHIYRKLGVETRMAAATRALTLATSQKL